jgi:small GTP-binding protein
MLYHSDDIYNMVNGSSEAATEPEFVGPTFKVLLVGDGNVGKSAFVNRTLTGGFVPHAYDATMGGVWDDCDFQTNFGTVRFEIVDIAGQDKRSGFRDGHYEVAECAIIMFDVTSPRSYESVARWRNEIQRVCGAALPIVVCGNKVDAHDEASRSWLRSHEARHGGYSSADDCRIWSTLSQEERHQQMMQMMQILSPDKLKELLQVMMHMMPPQKLEELR